MINSKQIIDNRLSSKLDNNIARIISLTIIYQSNFRISFFSIINISSNHTIISLILQQLL